MAQVFIAKQWVLHPLEEDVYVCPIGGEVHVRTVPAAEVLNVEVKASLAVNLYRDAHTSTVSSQWCNPDAVTDVQGRKTRGVLTEDSPRKVCQRIGELSRLFIERSFLSTHR